MNTIIATFATQNAAKEAERDLRDSGFVAVSIEREAALDDVVGNHEPEDLPDDVGEFVDTSGNLVDELPIVGLAGPNNPTNIGTSAPLGVPIVAETVNGHAETRLTVKTNDYVDRAVKISTDNGGTLATDNQDRETSTRDEVANPAQAPDRLK